MPHYQDLINNRLCMDASTLIQGHLCNDNRKYTQGYLSATNMLHREVGSMSQEHLSSNNHVTLNGYNRGWTTNGQEPEVFTMKSNGINFHRTLAHSYSLAEVPPRSKHHPNVHYHTGFPCGTSNRTPSEHSGSVFLPAHSCIADHMINGSSARPPTLPPKTICQDSIHRQRRNLDILDSRSGDALDHRCSSTGQSSPEQCSDSSLEHPEEFGSSSIHSNLHASVPFHSTETMNKTASTEPVPAKSPTLSNKGITKKWRKFKSASSMKSGDCLWTPGEKVSHFVW